MHRNTLLFKVGVKAVVISANKKLLLLRRGPLQSRAGGWNLPGGALEDELPEVGLLREILEETGLKLNDPKLIASYFLPSSRNDVPTLQLGYVVKSASKSITLSNEHDDFIWAKQNDIDQFKLPPQYASLVQTATQISDMN